MIGLGVRSYGMSVTTLEEVFIKVTWHPSYYNTRSTLMSILTDLSVFRPRTLTLTLTLTLILTLTLNLTLTLTLTHP